MYYDPAATGERIQNLRKDREVTQEQLAIDLNISDRYMRNLEKGEKVPSVDLFVELRERFGSSLDYIVFGCVCIPAGTRAARSAANAPQRTERNAAADSCYAGNAGRICLKSLYCSEPERLVPAKNRKTGTTGS